MSVILINESLHRLCPLIKCIPYWSLTVLLSASLQWIKSKSLECLGSACLLSLYLVSWYIFIQGECSRKTRPSSFAVELSLVRHFSLIVLSDYASQYPYPSNDASPRTHLFYPNYRELC